MTKTLHLGNVAAGTTFALELNVTEIQALLFAVETGQHMSHIPEESRGRLSLLEARLLAEIDRAVREWEKEQVS